MRLRVSSLLAMLVAGAALAPAQSPLGTITGTITDSQQARVPGVEVIAVNTGTGLTYKTASSSEGTYVIANVPIGKYQVNATASGFKTFQRTDIVLEVSQRLRLDIKLELGALAETVTVTGEVSRVGVEQATLGTVVEKQRIEELPLNGRHVFNLVKLVAGVRPVDRTTDGFAEISNQGFSQITFNGGPVYGNQFFVDGGMNTVPVHNEISVVPMTDAVEEFKVETNSLKAEFGQTSGGVVNVVTKGGTNDLHGSLYEFFRNDALDARHAFATQRDPLTGRIKPVLRYNQYGGTVGGPVYLPKIYNGKNRTFFFFGYEQWRQSTSSLRRSTVPTELQRAGNFSKTFDGKGALIPIYDPATTLPNPSGGGGYVRSIFPGNVVPTNRMDPVSLNVLDYMPLPNAVPDSELTNANNYLSLAATPVKQGVMNSRIDHRFSDKNSLLVRYTSNRNTRQGRGWGLGVADPDIFARRDQRDNHNFIVTETHIVTPTIINEVKVNFTRQNLPFLHPSYGENLPDQLGLPQIFPRDLFPRVNINGMLPLGSDPFAAGRRAQNTLQFGDSISIVKGKHQIKAGVDQRWNRLNYAQYRNISGNFNFSTDLTGNPLKPAGTGVGTATFLLGTVSSGTQEFVPAFSFHSWSNGVYVQDDYKITPHFTLNLGLRYDLSSAPVERHDRFSNFDPFVMNSETGMPGVLTYAGVTSPRHFVDRDNNNFGPRFGFAWDATGDGKTAIRGGYGLVYLLVESGDTQGDASNSFGFSAATPFSPVGGGPYPAFRFSEGPATLNRPLGPNGGPTAMRGQSVRYQDRNAPTPYLQQWNLTIQRELPGKWVGTVAYAGNKGTKLFGANYNLNQMDPAYWSLQLGLQQKVDNPFYGQITSGVLSGAKVDQSYLLTPFPDYLGVTTYGNHGSSSIYHSLQATVEKRYSNGLSALISYTNSKQINDSYSSAGSNGAIGEFRLGRFNRDLDRAIDQNDVTHRMVASAVYELPFGPKKAFLSGARGVVGHLVGGWQVNTITTIESGTPLSVRGANNFTGIGWPDVIFDPTLGRSERSVTRWFNTDAFRNPPNWVLGNAPRTLPNTRGPAMFDVSLSAAKTFQIQETTGLEFRAETFNTLNHVNYTNPGTSFTAGADGTNTNSQFGRITNSLAARRVQLGLRLTF